jgi:hypothetical protein
MACGPSEKLKELAAQVQAAEDKFDSLINSSPLGKLNEIKNDALEDVNGILGKMENMIPSILNKVLSAADKTLHDDVKDLLKFIMLGALALPQIESQLAWMKSRWGNLDLGDIKNFDDLRRALENGAVDLDNLCKLIPNVEEEGVNVVVRATPTSFPDIDPAAIIKGEPLPDYRKPKVTIKVYERAREQAEEFINLELPDFGT